MWRVDWWHISGVHTGWRVLRGSGLSAEIAAGFAFDRYRDGDYEAKKEAAHRFCRRLNLGVEKVAA